MADKVEVLQPRISGFGVFALDDIPVGAIVLTIDDSHVQRGTVVWMQPP